MNPNIRSLPPVKNPTNSILVEQKFSNVDKAFKDLIAIAKKLPRTKEIINDKHYWKGVCRSFFLRFPDELEILKLQQEGNNNYFKKEIIIILQELFKSNQLLVLVNMILVLIEGG